MYRSNWLLAVLCGLFASGTCGIVAPCRAGEDRTDKKAAEKPLKKIRTPDVIFLPTPQDVVERMLQEVKVTAKDLVYDLGCGDGRIVVTAAKKYGSRGVGYDIDPQRVTESRENVKKNKVEELVTIEQADIFKLDLSKANVITLYLLPELNVRLIPQLEKLKPGSRIVSHDFNMRGVKPDRVVRMWSQGDNDSHTIYLWTAPINKNRGAGGNYSIVQVDEELKILKTSEFKALRKESLEEYRSALKSWKAAKKEAEDNGREFSNARPKRKTIRLVASHLETEELAREKLVQLKEKKKAPRKARKPRKKEEPTTGKVD